MKKDTNIDPEYFHSDFSDGILKCFYRVYNELGIGFLESVYEKALCQELYEYGFNVESQFPIQVYYKGRIVGNFKADIIVDQKVMIELKAVGDMNPKFEAQLLIYLRATEIEVGLLLNFGPKPHIKRLLFDNSRKKFTCLSL